MAQHSPLRDEFDFYIEHQAELVQKYDGKYVVIKSDRILGVYDDELAAVEETRKTEEMGTFLVQLVSPGDDAYRQTFHSRVAFV